MNKYHLASQKLDHKLIMDEQMLLRERKPSGAHTFSLKNNVVMLESCESNPNGSQGGFSV